MDPEVLPLDELVAGAEQAPIALSLIDEEYRLVWANPAHDRLYGFEPGSTRGMRVEDLSRPEDREWTTSYLARLFSGELDGFTSQKAFPDGAGRERQMRVQLWPVISDGRVTHLCGSLIALPPPRQLSDRRLQKLLERIDDTVSLLDRDGTIIETSGRYRSFIGYPPSYWEQRSILEVLDPDELPKLVEFRERLLAAPGEGFASEFHLRTADGSLDPVHVHAVNLLDDPDVRGVVVTARSVVEERTMMRELARRTEAAESEARLRSRLIATVSHELRNPLHAMGGLAELLVGSDLAGESAGLAATLHRQINGLATVIDDLLDSSRIDAAGITLRTNSVAIRPLVDDVCALAGASIGERRLMVTVDVAPSVPAVVEADAARLRQILSNLVGNAVKFTEVGAVRLFVDVVADPSNPDPSVRFVVADTGRGIPADDLHSIFEPFATARNSGVSTGAGLGLTIVRQLVALMRGQVTAESTVGQGSIFTVVLPLRPAKSVEEVVARTARMSDRGPVLVVEDNDVNQMLAESQLSRLGIECEIVDSGEAALVTMARADAPRLVLMDFQLPGIDGLETTRRLRAAERDGRPRSVIIGVTASAMAADRAACREAGMDDFLAKPVSLAQLGAVLDQWMPIVESPRAPVVEPAVIPGPVRVIDDHVLAELASQLDIVTVAQLVEAYVGELPARSGSLVQAARRGDIEAARRAAHTLKGTSLMLGAIELGRACRALELIDRAGELLRAADGVEHLAEATDHDMKVWLSAMRGETR